MQPTPFPGVKGATIYITADGLPTKDNNSRLAMTPKNYVNLTVLLLFK